MKDSMKIWHDEECQNENIITSCITCVHIFDENFDCVKLCGSDHRYYVRNIPDVKDN